MTEETPDDKKKFSDRAKEKAVQVRHHLQDHKTGYIVGTTGVSCLVIGGAAGLAFGRADVKQFVDSLKLIHLQYKSPNINIALVKQAYPDPIPVLDKETGISYPSMKYAAKATQQAYDYIRKDVHGAQNRFEGLPDSVFA